VISGVGVGRRCPRWPRWCGRASGLVIPGVEEPTSPGWHTRPPSVVQAAARSVTLGHPYPQS
jgi:hypothetical protein